MRPGGRDAIADALAAIGKQARNEAGSAIDASPSVTYHARQQHTKQVGNKREVHTDANAANAVLSAAHTACRIGTAPHLVAIDAVTSPRCCGLRPGDPNSRFTARSRAQSQPDRSIS